MTPEFFTVDASIWPGDRITVPEYQPGSALFFLGGDLMRPGYDYTEVSDVPGYQTEIISRRAVARGTNGCRLSAVLKPAIAENRRH